VLARFWLHDAGETVCEPVDPPQTSLALPKSGRAPPSIAWSGSFSQQID